MKKRDFNKLFLLSAFSPSLAFASKLGFRTVSDEGKAEEKNGKIVIREFFWYGCSHCHRFDPKLNEWLKKLPSGFVFEKVPVGWASKRVNFEGHQRFFYALESLTVPYSVHKDVFDALASKKTLLANDAEIFEFVEKHNSLDLNKFQSVYSSFSVETSMRKASALAKKLKVDSVPTVSVGDVFLTSPSDAGSDEKCLLVLDMLLHKVKERSPK